MSRTFTVSHQTYPEDIANAGNICPSLTELVIEVTPSGPT